MLKTCRRHFLQSASNTPRAWRVNKSCTTTGIQPAWRPHDIRRSRFFVTSRSFKHNLTTTITAPNGHTYDQPTGLFINNAFVLSSTSTFQAIDPTTSTPITTVQSAEHTDITTAVSSAFAAFTAPSWQEQDPTSRRDLLLTLASLISTHTATLAAIESLDTGKSYQSSLYDISDAIATLRYYAGWGDKLTGSLHNLGSSKLAYTVREPLGVCALITPYNYPLCSAVWKLAPAIAAGNAVIIKPSEHTSLSTLYLASLAREAGFPAGILSVLPGPGSITGAALSAHPDIAKIAFTGSTRTAQLVSSAASSTLKALTLETGGKSPLLVFEDADIEQAVRWAYAGVFENSGQICTSTARMLVAEGVYEVFVDELVRYTRSRVKVGSPWREETTMGPLVTRESVERVRRMVKEGVQQGGRLVLGGGDEASVDMNIAGHEDGHWVSPHIFTHVPDSSPLARDEIFGPVAVICTPFRTEDEAVARANDTQYGLGAAVFTRDIGRAHRVARRIRAGMVWVNSSQDCDPRIPFGGVKMSGVGRELGEEGIRAYSQEKAVHVNLGMKL